MKFLKSIKLSDNESIAFHNSQQSKSYSEWRSEEWSNWRSEELSNWRKERIRHRIGIDIKGYNNKRLTKKQMISLLKEKRVEYTAEGYGHQYGFCLYNFDKKHLRHMGPMRY